MLERKRDDDDSDQCNSSNMSKMRMFLTKDASNLTYFGLRKLPKLKSFEN